MHFAAIYILAPGRNIARMKVRQKFVQNRVHGMIRLYLENRRTFILKERMFEKQHGYLASYVYNFDNLVCSEFGDIVVSSGALI